MARGVISKVIDASGQIRQNITYLESLMVYYHSLESTSVAPLPSVLPFKFPPWPPATPELPDDPTDDDKLPDA